MKTIIPFLFLAATLFLFSCEKEPELTDMLDVESPINIDSNLLTDKTIISIRLTDDPLVADEVNIDLQGIEVIVDNASFYPEVNAGIYNLLDYQDEIDTLISTSSVEGDYLEEIRLILGDQNTIVVDSISYDLFIPSGSQSGLKIKINRDLSSLDTLPLLLDFDACKSVHKLGNGNYHLKPVINLIGGNQEEEDEDDEEEEEDDEEEEEDDDGNDELDQNVLDSLAQIYSGYEIEDAEYKELCFLDFQVIVLELENDSIEMNIILDSDYIELGTIIKLTDQNLPENIADYLTEHYPNSNIHNQSRIYTINGINYYRIRLTGQGNTTIYLDDELTKYCD